MPPKVLLFYQFNFFLVLTKKITTPKTFIVLLRKYYILL